MVLVADAGNTNIKLGIYVHERLTAITRLPTDEEKTPEAFERDLERFLQENKITTEDIGGAAVSTVVPEATGTFLEGVRQFLHKEPLVVTHETITGIQIKTDVPAQLGADRLVNAAAAFRYYGGPVIAIDFGTATTYDVITGKGEFLGGVIAPGVRICAEALWQRTARLPEIPIEKPAAVLGTNTVSSMKSGVFYGYLGQLEYFIRRLKQEAAVDCRVVATGGLSGIFAGSTDAIDFFDPDLTLRGLNYIYTLNSR